MVRPNDANTSSAVAFYGDVLGWRVVHEDVGGSGYKAFSTDAGMMGGIISIPADAAVAGLRSSWTGYIYVDDVDDMAGRITAAGGMIIRPPTDVPGICRFAVAVDPHGAIFNIFGPLDMLPQSPIAAPGSHGSIGWHQLAGGDLTVDWTFYESLFGWTKTGEFDMLTVA